MRLPFRFAAVAAAALAVAVAPAYADMPRQDTVKGGKDHPLLSRFEGARLVGYDRKDYEEASLPAGKRTGSKDGKSVFEKTLRLEGRYTRLAYNYPRERSSLRPWLNGSQYSELPCTKLLPRRSPSQ